MECGVKMWFLMIVVIILSTACSVQRYVPEDKILLVSNEVVFEDEVPLDEKLRTELTKEILNIDSILKPNSRNLLQSPGKLSRYYRLTEKQKFRKLERKLKTARAEYPKYVDKAKSKRSEEIIKVFLFNKGYMHSDVWTEDDSLGAYTASTKYHVTLGPLIEVSQIEYRYPTEAVRALLEPLESMSFLAPGSSLTLENASAEYQRIQDVMQNNGFFYFTVQNIKSPVGYANTESTKSVIIDIRNDRVGKTLQRYSVGDVLVNRFYDPYSAASDVSRVEEYDGIRFVQNADASQVKMKYLARGIYFRPGEMLNLAEINRSKRRLQQLRFYQSPTFIFNPSPEDSSLMDVGINLSPLDKIQLRYNFDVNLISDDNSRFFGFELSTQYVDNNLFGGSELFTASLDGEFQFVLGALDEGQSRQNYVSAGPSFNLTVPRYTNFLGLYSLTKSLRMGSENLYDLMSSRGRTFFDLSFRYDAVDRELVSSTYAFRGGNKINWANGRRSLAVTHVDMYLYNPRRGAAFNENNNPLRDRILQPTFITSFLLGDISYTSSSRKTDGWQYRTNSLLDFSGLEVLLLESLFGGGDTWSLFGDHFFARYIRLDQSHIVSKDFAYNTLLISRLNYGLALPLKGSQDGIPFIRQFSLGGSNSMRAWQFRDVGVGGYLDEGADSSAINYLTGDVKIELNLEYRFPIIAFSNLPFELHGALFTDIGNIWNIDNSIELREFGKDFVDQLAVGAGAGLRFDLSFFILRLDLAWPLRNSYADENGSHRVGDDLFASFGKRPTLQLGVGYPF